jgi:hypothetical protein
VLFLLALLGAALPSSADVHAFEVSRVLGPLTDHTRDATPFVEFAPAVETRNAKCISIRKNVADCDYQARAREFFAQEFSPWEMRHERLVWRNKCWLREDRSQ